MIGITNLGHMTLSGWEKRYSEIIKEFGYSKTKDLESAKKLNRLLKNKFPLKKYNSFTKIVADGAVKALLENKIIPDIVVSDLDGDKTALKKIGKKNTIMVVHAHGDNFDKLELIKNFKNCIGTTEARSFGKIHNFGGFTDGDRCVFLAHHFKAKRIFLVGMDFGNKIGKYSKTKISNKKIKLKKLRRGKKLLEWLASKNSSILYTTSKPIKGFKKIHYSKIEKVLSD